MNTFSPRPGLRRPMLVAAIPLLCCAWATTSWAQGAITKKARQINLAKENRKMLFEAVDVNGDRAISPDEFFDAYTATMVDSPKVKKQANNAIREPTDVSEEMFNLVDLNSDLKIDRTEAEKSLAAGVLTFKYRYVPTEDEKHRLESARKAALNNEEIKAELEAAARLREQAAAKWDDAALRKKAQAATLKATRNLHREMMNLDAEVKAILEKIADTKP